MFRSKHHREDDDRKRGDDDRWSPFKEKFKKEKTKVKKEKKPKGERESFPGKALKRMSEVFSRPFGGKTPSKPKEPLRRTDVHRVITVIEEDEQESSPSRLNRSNAIRRPNSAKRAKGPVNVPSSGTPRSSPSRLRRENSIRRVNSAKRIYEQTATSSSRNASPQKQVELSSVHDDPEISVHAEIHVDPFMTTDTDFGPLEQEQRLKHIRPTTKGPNRRPPTRVKPAPVELDLAFSRPWPTMDTDTDFSDQTTNTRSKASRSSLQEHHDGAGPIEMDITVSTALPTLTSVAEPGPTMNTATAFSDPTTDTDIGFGPLEQTHLLKHIRPTTKGPTRRPPTRTKAAPIEMDLAFNTDWPSLSIEAHVDPVMNTTTAFTDPTTDTDIGFGPLEQTQLLTHIRPTTKGPTRRPPTRKKNY